MGEGLDRRIVSRACSRWFHGFTLGSTLRIAQNLFKNDRSALGYPGFAQNPYLKKVKLYLAICFLVGLFVPVASS